MNTTGNSRPFAAWSVISVTASASPSYASWSATRAVSSSSRSSASSGREVVVAGRHRAQLEQVRPALLAVLGAVGEHRPVARRLEDVVEQLGQRQHPDARPEPTDEGGELGQGDPRPRRELVDLAPAARSIASQVVTPSRRWARRRTSIVLSPIARAGTLMIRSKLTESVSDRRTRRYASASLTSRRL